MKLKKNYYALVATIMLMIVTGGCTKNNSGTSSLYTPTSADATAKATLAELQQGRDLYIKNCNRCHGLYSPDNYVPAQWKSIMNNMAPSTTMTSSEILLVTKYLCRGNQ
jgi:mono/diheme cytochrome c family protein